MERMRYNHPYYNYRPHPPYTPQQIYTPLNQNNFPTMQQTPYEIFAKPEQPMDLINQLSNLNAQGFNQSQQNPNPNGMSPNEQGQQMDFDKMLTTVGQLANTYHQVSPIIKQIGSLFNIIR